jgi:CMP-N-acetylneuraminic acid synthetase
MEKSIDDVCVVISARLNSDRTPQKLVAPFAGTTLLDILLSKLLGSKVIPKKNILLASYERELLNIAEKYNIPTYRRSKESSESEGEDLTVLYEWYDKIDYKYVVLINPCVPFLSIQTIDKFFSAYVQSKHDGLFGVIPKKNYYWNMEGNLITDWPKEYSLMNTKFVAPTYEAAHCLYGSRLDIIKKGHWMGKPPYKKDDPALFELAEKECFDIDYVWQFEIAEVLYREMDLR